MIIIMKIIVYQAGIESNQYNLLYWTISYIVSNNNDNHNHNDDDISSGRDTIALMALSLPVN